MKNTIIIFLLGLSMNACSQDNGNRTGSTTEREVGEAWEGRNAIYECPVPFEALSWSDTLPGFNGPGQRILIEGVVYKAGGKVPASNVVIYVYHTDQAGIYPKLGNEKGWAKQHGYIRGWLRTNEKGEYRFYTLKPASYPNTNAVKHIHTIIKEPGIKPYSIESFLFDDDPFLVGFERNNPRPKGGNGVVKLTEMNGISIGKRDIILGKNISGY